MIRRLLPLFTILATYLIIGALYALYTPAWQAPDEPAHYNYIRQIVQGCCPFIAAGDWDSAYLERIKAAKFAPDALEDRLDSMQYEDHQPPLYYALLTPVFALAGGSLAALRLASLILGTGGVIAAWVGGRIVFPAGRWLAILAAGFVAFLPQYLAIMGSVNNDSLAVALSGGMLVWALRRLLQPEAPSRWWIAALLAGAACLTKLTIYPIVIILGVAAVLAAWREGRRGLALLREALPIALITVLIAAPFWLTNLSRYGFPDVLAQAAHDRIVVGQPQTADYIAAHGGMGWLADLTKTTFQSFWGQFGWMGIPMTETIYGGLLALTGIAYVGGVTGLIVFKAARRRIAPALFVMGGALLVTAAAFAYYNTKFVQFQGRYLYPALVPLALVFAGGVGTWIALLSGRWRGGRVVVASLLVVGLAAFALYVLLRIVLPGLRVN
ncbi:MAG: DUF2142 domain-containing protein [Anaerolineales bacterium]|nr:DUF2142 domain-containing protein [Anaerolineales bacterium]